MGLSLYAVTDADLCTLHVNAVGLLLYAAVPSLYAVGLYVS